MALILVILGFVGGVFVGYRLPDKREPFIASMLGIVGIGKEKGETPQEEMKEKKEPPIGDPALVTQVLDGDTIIIESGEQVRYIGTDAPEITVENKEVCFADKATEINELLVGGKIVRLVRDTNDRDQLNRLLRYVYVEDENGEGIMVNEKLIAEGAALATPYPPDTKFEKRFAEAETQAKTAKRGLWSACVEK